MKKEKEIGSSFFYIKHANMGQFFQALKNGLNICFWLGLFGVITTYFFGDSRNETSSLGIPNFIWYLGFFAFISWFSRGEEINFKIPRFVFWEWVLLNVVVITLVLSHKYSDQWFNLFYLLFIFLLFFLFFTLYGYGRENLEKN